MPLIWSGIAKSQPYHFVVVPGSCISFQQNGYLLISSFTPHPRPRLPHLLKARLRLFLRQLPLSFPREGAQLPQGDAAVPHPGDLAASGLRDPVREVLIGNSHHKKDRKGIEGIENNTYNRCLLGVGISFIVHTHSRTSTCCMILPLF